MTDDGLTIRGLTGLGEVRAGADIAVEITRLCPDLADGDVIVVTSKIVSKAEGRVQAGTERDAAIDAETVRTVAAKGPTRIVETRHGLVMAAAGVDASNTDDGTIVLLPLDPDASARRIRNRLREITGRSVAVIVTDTAGRPWREGQTDIAIGVAGFTPLLDLRGTTDAHGRVLDVTVTALADEVAGAADLVKGKASGIPVAVVSGLRRFVLAEDGPGAKALIRPASDDMFRLGTAEAIRQGASSAVAARRTVRRFLPAAVDPALVMEAIAAALTAPAPHHTQPVRFVLLKDRREELLHAMAAQWRADLYDDGMSETSVEQRVRRGDVLVHAPIVVIPCLVRDGAHDYRDVRREQAELRMFDLAAGAAVEAFLVQLSALDLGACWVSSTLFCPAVVAEVLELPSDWEPVGAVAIGWPESAPAPRHSQPTDWAILER